MKNKMHRTLPKILAMTLTTTLLAGPALAKPNNFAKNGGFIGLWQGVNPVNGAVETASLVPIGDGTISFTFSTPQSDICTEATGGAFVGSSIARGRGILESRNKLVVENFRIFCGSSTTDPNTLVIDGGEGVVLVDSEADIIFSPSGEIFNPAVDVAFHRISSPLKRKRGSSHDDD